jgi:hypothetical protein
MAEYVIEVYSLDLTTNRMVRIDEIITYQNLRFFSRLNGIGGASFSLNIYDKKARPANFKRWRTNILIRRDGNPVWCGPLRKITGNLRDIDGTINLEFLSYGAHLMARHSDQLTIYSDTDAADIVDGLITQTQAKTNGSLLIDVNIQEYPGNTTDTLEYKPILDAMINQSDNLIGYDFEFVPMMDADSGLWDYVSLNIAKSFGSYRNDLPVLDMEGVEAIDFASQDDIYNAVTVLGSGTGTTIPRATAEDVGSQIGFTRREIVYKESDESNQQNITMQAETYLAQNSGDKMAFNVTIKPDTNLPYGSYILGDVLQYNLVVLDGDGEATFINFNGSQRISELAVSVDENGVEKVTPKFILTI